MKRFVKVKKGTDKDRGVGVLLENIDSKVDMIAEGYTSLDKKIEDGSRKLKEFRDETSYKFDVALEQLRLIRNELKEKISRDEFVTLENRVVRLEKMLHRR